MASVLAPAQAKRSAFQRASTAKRPVGSVDVETGRCRTNGGEGDGRDPDEDGKRGEHGADFVRTNGSEFRHPVQRNGTVHQLGTGASRFDVSLDAVCLDPRIVKCLPLTARQRDADLRVVGDFADPDPLVARAGSQPDEEPDQSQQDRTTAFHG